MRSALRDAEVTPPADGWARLERELKTPAPRISVLRRYWPRIAAAAAAVLIFVGGGELLLHENRSLGDKGFVIASATDGGSSAADNRTYPAGGIGTLEESLRAVVPSQEAVRAESLPGGEAQARQAVRAAYPATAVARNAAPTVVAVDVTDFRRMKLPQLCGRKKRSRRNRPPQRLPACRNGRLRKKTLHRRGPIRAPLLITATRSPSSSRNPAGGLPCRSLRQAA